MASNENDNSARSDEAVSARLRALSSMPVDLSRLQRAIDREVPRPEHQQQQRSMRFRLFRPLSAIAASITVLAMITAALLMTSSNEVMASPAQMAKFHREIVSNKIPVTKVDSIEAASQVLAQQSPGSPDLPAAPDAHVMACCMTSIKNRKVACVLLKSEGTPITMSVANGSDMRSPGGRKVMRDGSAYHVVPSDSLNMVSTERHGRWVCLIGEATVDRLIDIAAKLQF
jgi:hypothetical protein